MLTRVIPCILIGITITPPARGASIGLFSDPNCTSCNLEIPDGQTGTFYISAVNVGNSPELCNSLQGAELRVIGLPPGWTALAEPNPAAHPTVGDPMQCGADIAFAHWQTSNCILLYAVTVQATSQVNEVELTVVAHCNPSYHEYACPLMVTECGVAFLKRCVPGGSLFVNSSRPCTVSGQNVTWSAVKQLYD